MPAWFDWVFTNLGADSSTVRVLFFQGDPAAEVGARLRHSTPVAELTVRFFSPDEGGGDVREISLRTSSQLQGLLTPSFLRRFPWEKWVTAADAYAVGRVSNAHSTDFLSPGDSAIRATRGQRPGRRGHDAGFLPGIAHRYVELRKEGVRAPVQRIADEHTVSRNTAAGWIKQARAAGLLPPARRPGKAG